MGRLRRREPRPGAARRWWLAASTLALAGCTAGVPDDAPLVVLAPDHLAPLVEPLIELWHGQGGTPLRVRYDAPDRIARQVDSGTPSALVLTGDGAWMDRLQSGGHVRSEDRRAIALDELVVVQRPGPHGPGPEPVPGGDGHLFLEASACPVVLPRLDRPPGPAAARFVADLVRGPGARLRQTEVSEELLLQQLSPGEAAVLRESQLLSASAELQRFPVRGRLDLASTVELGALVDAPGTATAFTAFVAEHPSAIQHVLALELGMPNPRRQPANPPPPPPEPVGPLRPGPRPQTLPSPQAVPARPEGSAAGDPGQPEGSPPAR